MPRWEWRRRRCDCAGSRVASGARGGPAPASRAHARHGHGGELNPKTWMHHVIRRRINLSSTRASASGPVALDVDSAASLLFCTICVASHVIRSEFGLSPPHLQIEARPVADVDVDVKTIDHELEHRRQRPHHYCCGVRDHHNAADAQQRHPDRPTAAAAAVTATAAIATTGAGSTTTVAATHCAGIHLEATTARRTRRRPVVPPTVVDGGGGVPRTICLAQEAAQCVEHDAAVGEAIGLNPKCRAWA